MKPVIDTLSDPALAPADECPVSDKPEASNTGAGEACSGDFSAAAAHTAHAAGLLEQVVAHHDRLVARVADHGASSNTAEVAIGNLQRQLRIQAAVVDAAVEIVEELMLCDGISGADTDQAKLANHQQQLLDEIRGFANRSVSA